MGVGMVFLLKVIHIMMSLSMIWCDDSLGLLCFFVCISLYPWGYFFIWYISFEVFFCEDIKVCMVNLVYIYILGVHT